jgi:hypothetical protein
MSRRGILRRRKRRTDLGLSWQIQSSGQRKMETKGGRQMTMIWLAMMILATACGVAFVAEP